MINRLLMLWSFLQARFFLRFKSNSGLQRWQRRRLLCYRQKVLSQAPGFQTLPKEGLQAIKSCSADNMLVDIPIMDKASMMTDFVGHNTAGINLETALQVAKSAEVSRDFVPTINGFTVGMSSGTSGNQGVFLVSERERMRWAGILLAKTMPDFIFRQILCFWRPAVRIGFFLRANSNLYTTLNSRRIRFEFYDLLGSMADNAQRLCQQNPDILVAPSTVLMGLAKQKGGGELNVKPQHIIAVAEVLTDEAASYIEAAFGVAPHQIYQATEGFLAYTCENGSLHLNESHIYFEKQWLDDKRFEPVITDFTRTTQTIVRYKLNDILVAGKPCSCGRIEQRLERIEGRADEVLWLLTKSNEWHACYPDALRRLLLLADDDIAEYCIVQEESTWTVSIELKNSHFTVITQQQAFLSIRECLERYCFESACYMPSLKLAPWQTPKKGAKLRRLHCLSRGKTKNDKSYVNGNNSNGMDLNGELACGE